MYHILPILVIYTCLDHTTELLNALLLDCWNIWLSNVDNVVIETWERNFRSLCVVEDDTVGPSAKLAKQRLIIGVIAAVQKPKTIHIQSDRWPISLLMKNSTWITSITQV